MPTIRDVAARAGVSVSTVSRVLNQSGYADADTRARVLKAAAALNYQPNANWSRLRSQSSHTILYLLANRDNINSFHMRLLVSCERTLQSRGYDLTFSRYEYTRSLAPADLPLPRMLEKSGAVDGILLAGVHHPNLLQLLDKRRIPHVMLGNDFDGPPAQLARNCVFFDDGAGIADAVDHLVRLGHRRIAFVGNVEFPWFRRRFQAFASTMDRHGLAPAAVTAHWPVVNTEYGQLAAAQLLRADATPTAIVAGNDELAAGVWKELTRRGIAIPRQVSLIGCGDRPEFNILEPELSSIAVFVDQLGERLTAMLLRRIENPKQSAPSETYPCKLVERASCAPPL